MFLFHHFLMIFYQKNILQLMLLACLVLTGFLRASISFGFLSLTVSYGIRYILTKVLIVLSPFALLSLASNKTSTFFKVWFKSFLAILFLQIFVAVILLVCFVINSNDTFLPSQIMYLGMIYTLFKANTFVKEFVGGFSTDVNLNSYNLSNLFKGGVSK